jgi:hypothetical protein
MWFSNNGMLCCNISWFVRLPFAKWYDTLQGSADSLTCTVRYLDVLPRIFHHESGPTRITYSGSCRSSGGVFLP